MITREITWISVDEALPDKDGRYLIVSELLLGGYSYDTAYFSKTGKYLHYVNGDLSKEKNIWTDYDSEYGDVPFCGVKYWAEIPKITEERNR